MWTDRLKVYMAFVLWFSFKFYNKTNMAVCSTGTELHTSTPPIGRLHMASIILSDWSFCKIVTFLKRSLLAMKTFSSLCICFSSCGKSNTWGLLETAWHGVCFHKTFLEQVLHKIRCQIMTHNEIYRLLTKNVNFYRTQQLTVYINNDCKQHK